MKRATERKIRVVIIDDNHDVLFFAKTLFSVVLPDSIRVNTTTHVDWESVVSNWDEVAVAVVDILMPISGLVVLRRIKEQYPHVQLIAWTAVDDSVRREIEEEGLAIVISKPNHKELEDIVLRMVVK